MSERVTPKCPRCFAEQGDWLLCQKCSARLREQLAELPGLMRELQVNVTRQSRRGAGGKINERPLPVEITASYLYDDVKLELVTWVRDLDYGDTQWQVETCTCEPYRACRGWEIVTLTDAPADLCAWLLDRVERIRGHVAVDEIVGGIDYMVKQVWQAIDRPADKEFCGTCPVCDGDLYSKRGVAKDFCRKCRAAGIETEYVPGDMREDVKARVEHQWATAGVCSTVLGSFGLEVKAETVQNWARPGKPKYEGDPPRPPKLHPRGVNQLGHAVYAIGDVMDLAKEQRARKVRQKASLTRCVSVVT